MPVRELPDTAMRHLPDSPRIESMPSVKSCGQVRTEMAEREKQLVAFMNDRTKPIGEREAARARLSELRFWRSRLAGLIAFQRP